MKPITWQTRDLSRLDVETLLGKGIVALWFASNRQFSIEAAEIRAHNAWMANDRESHAAYRSLHNLLKESW